MCKEICGECKEVWKDIQGLEGEYQVSNQGRVKRVKTGNILKNSVNNSGYVRVNLKRKVRLVHRLVAEAFIPNPYNYPCINHKDENKANPHFENLEWCTAKYNLEYNGGKERRAKPRRLRVYSVDANGNIERFESITQASIAVGKSTGNICGVLRGDRKTSAGRKWFYTDTCECFEQRGVE